MTVSEDQKQQPAQAAATAPDLVADFVARDHVADWLSDGAAAGAARTWHPVAAAARAFAAAALRAAAPPRRWWVVCRHLREQERLQAELETWGAAPLFFPESEALPDADAAGDPEIAAERLHVLRRLAASPGQGVVVLVEGSLRELVSPPEDFQQSTLVLNTGGRLDPEALVEKLEAAGYEREPQVFARGQFSVRGGIIDLFAWQAGFPIRCEFFDDEIESLREFELHSQVSIRKVNEASILLSSLSAVDSDSTAGARIALADWISAEDGVICFEGDDAGAPDFGRTNGVWVLGDDPSTRSDGAVGLLENPMGGFEAGDFVLSEARQEEFVRQVDEWVGQAWRVTMVFGTDGELARFRDIAEARGGGLEAVELVRGTLAMGFVCPDARCAVLSAEELFGRFSPLRSRRRFNRRAAHHRIRSGFDSSNLEGGEYVVHAEYGIARYHGVERQHVSGGEREVMVLEYAEQARLFVPIEQAHLVSRYVGTGSKAPTLSKLGEARWTKLRAKAERDIEDYAARLLEIHAARDSTAGFAHAPDNRWQWEFENAFPFRETPDQIKAIRETKADMEAPHPMDRLICGDVGFGKTEVAIRAAFKAVMSGTQVCVLAPTTVLAQQHFDTFRNRMSGFPVRVEALSRLQSPAEQAKVLEEMRQGSVDIVIGTHRLISKDVVFKQLGLVVIDEEQRFGVKHKERFKEMFRLVDVLTLSATPIPRTLYMSLTGLREMSTINTPPPNRLPVQTVVCAYDERVIRDAIRRELDRGGQVFFLHNRVGTISRVTKRLAELVPGAKAIFGHGQMDRHELEDVMHIFVRRDADILVATTIIESGIDIPNANTILIDRADLFGLADLYQLRGRVGRSEHKAYAYLFLPRQGTATGNSRRRLNAMKQYAALGSGFKVAMRDLEIRGAGHLLGTQQSGHIARIGFELYCQMLRQSVARLTGQRAKGQTDALLYSDEIAWSESALAATPDAAPAFLPPDYIGESSLRLQAYRELAECQTIRELRKLQTAWRDRFGAWPPPATNLLVTSAIRILASRAGISVVEIRDRKLMLTRNREFIQIEGRFPRLEATNPAARLIEARDWLRQL